MKLLRDDDLTPGGRRPSGPAARNDRHLLHLLADTMQPLIEDLREQIALLDEECNILAVNQAWRQTVEQQDYPAMPGDNYRTFCVEASSAGYDPAAQAVTALDDICSGRRSLWQLLYNGGERWDGRDFEVCFRGIGAGPERLVLVTRFDVTELMKLRRVRDDFASAMVEAQAVARQRLGRELHDGTSQLLTAMGLLIGRLKREGSSRDSLVVIDELQDLLAEARKEIRAISYLAHPPPLEKLGLPAAMKFLLEGFAFRTGFEASFEIRGNYFPLSPNAQAALYRVAQEALSNVHRHARANRVQLMLCCRAAMTHFVVADDGVGMSRDTMAGGGAEGVGLRSMRSRLSEIGGRTSVRRLSPGTAIIASVPREARTEPVRLL